MNAHFDLVWYVAATAPKREEAVMTMLYSAGIAAWVPKFSRVVRQGGKRHFVERHLLPSYVFVAFSPGREPWTVLSSINGIIGLVSIAGAPVAIPADDVARLMVGCLTGAYDQEQRRVGSRVRLTAGDASDQVGRIVKAPPGERLTVLLQGCGEPRLIEADLRQLAIT